MNTRRVGLPRRVAAYALDVVCVLFFFALTLRLLMFFSPLELPDIGRQLQDVPLSNSESVQGLINDWQIFLHSEVEPEGIERLEHDLLQRWSNTAEGYRGSSLGAYRAVITQLLQDFFVSVEGEISPESRPELELLAQRTYAALESVAPLGMAATIHSILRGYILVPLCVILGFWLTELLFGWSLGKKFMNITVRSMDGSPGNLAVFLSRFVFKHAGLIILTASFLLSVWWLVPTALVVQCISLIGCLRVLGSRKRAMHDVLSGTAVYYSRSL